MPHFKGTLDELHALLADLGFQGEWTDTGTGHQFRAIDGAILNWSPNTGKLWYQGKGAVKGNLQAAVDGRLTGTPYEAMQPSLPNLVRERGVEREKIFVVHGHDIVSREQLELVLHKLELEPFVLANTGGGGLTLIEALEAEVGPGAGRARFGIVLMTPDDVGYSKVAGVDKAEPRARQNVVLEMGMLIAALKRPNVAILKKGHMEVPSDAAGIIYIGYNDHVKEAVPRLVDRLRRAGFELHPEAITKATS
jgi:predicted nucleotide-binding protein